MSTKTVTAPAVDQKRLVRLCVSLTESESEVFFSLLAMSTGEQTDVDFVDLMAIEEKFRAARKPNRDCATVNVWGAPCDCMTPEERTRYLAWLGTVTKPKPAHGATLSDLTSN